MKVERLLQICVTTMAALGTLLLGMSQNSGPLVLMALLVAASSLMFTDFLGWFRLHRHAANAAATVAVMYSFWQSRGTGLEGQFLSVANLLIHLQIILLFQHKTRRIYWQLIVLSLLQVVVAAALNLFFLFGALVVIYLFVALTGLLLFFIYRETSPFLRATAANGSASSGEIHIEGVPDATGTYLAGCSTSDPQGSMRRGLIRHIGWISITTLVVTVIAFFLMPRYTNVVWSGPSRRIGFQPGMELDEMATILESPETVMRVRFLDHASAGGVSLTGEPYFRGEVLTIYGKRARRWDRAPQYFAISDQQGLEQAGSGRSSGRRRRRRGRRPWERLPEPTSSGIVRQDITLERLRNGILFGVCPAYHLGPPDASFQRDAATYQLHHQSTDDSGEADTFRYLLGTTAFNGGLQSAFIPALLEPEYSSLHQGWSDLPQLVRLAASVIDDSGLPEDDRLGRARALEDHFFESGRYKYSLDPSPNRNRAIDPLEDFVSNHQTGHCEYFASALALMLRSQGIPARVVQGYKGGTFNAVGNFYQVRELDAHAWVEAYLRPEDVPEDEVLPQEDLSGGAWVRLDPTPSGGIAAKQAMSGWRARLNDSMEYVQLLWSEYVLGLNQKRQRRVIYEPLLDALEDTAQYLLSREIWWRRWYALQARLKANTSEVLRGNWFHRGALLDAGVLACLLALLYFTIRVLWRFSRSWWRQRGRRQDAVRRTRVEFYQRLENVLSRRGFRRDGRQTPREFAAVVGEQLATDAHTISVAATPRHVVDAFYRVRFGNQRLDNQEVERLERSLSQLQQALADNSSK